jgi:hypothetical protein
MSKMATSKAVVCLWVAALFISTEAVSISSGSNVSDRHQQRAVRFTIEELLHTKFPSRISDDIDLDPCKGGKNLILLKINKVGLCLGEFSFAASRWRSHRGGEWCCCPSWQSEMAGK